MPIEGVRVDPPSKTKIPKKVDPLPQFSKPLGIYPPQIFGKTLMDPPKNTSNSVLYGKKPKKTDCYLFK
jgi:hypothetical protein